MSTADLPTGPNAYEHARVGSIICERHPDGQWRRVDRIDSTHVWCTGVASGRSTRIKVANLKRYVVVRP